MCMLQMCDIFLPSHDITKTIYKISQKGSILIGVEINEFSYKLSILKTLRNTETNLKKI